jgi:hypothetical protein
MELKMGTCLGGKRTLIPEKKKKENAAKLQNWEGQASCGIKKIILISG